MSTGTAASRGLGATARRDRWWVAPALVVAGLSAFGIYSLVAAALGTDFHYERDGADYLSPFYSPNLESLGLPISHAFLVLWVPLGFRLTCYYYRKAYYRSFFLAPPACAVGGARQGRYQGERRFPFILQNLHRYFLYLATIVLGFLWYDAIRAFFFRGDGGGLELGIGLGSLVLLANVLALTAFTFGCNSLRHLVGGRLNCFTCSASARARHGLWRRATVFNAKHMQWAWISLATVGIADLYVRLASAGVFDDPRIL